MVITGEIFWYFHIFSGHINLIYTGLHHLTWSKRLLVLTKEELTLAMNGLAPSIWNRYVKHEKEKYVYNCENAKILIALELPFKKPQIQNIPTRYFHSNYKYSTQSRIFMYLKLFKNHKTLQFDNYIIFTTSPEYSN